MRDSEFRSVPTLFLMCGLPGAGKTTLARRLEQEYAAVRLTPDEWISKILPADWSRDELDRLRSPVESLQWTLAERLLALGTSVVLRMDAAPAPAIDPLSAGSDPLVV